MIAIFNALAIVVLRIHRYSNMDYIFWSAVNSYRGRQITVSYDIMCQWYRNLLKRNANLPELLRRLDFVLRYVIPKFHISAHGPKCQTIFSFNFLPFMARTDGENIERGWAWMNPVSLSTQEMGPGARHDTLDCQWSAWNWRIITRLGMSSNKYYTYSTNCSQGTTIRRRLYNAVTEAREKREEFIEFSATFSEENVQIWMTMLSEWNKDPFNSPDPFREPAPCKCFLCVLSSAVHQ